MSYFTISYNNKIIGRYLEYLDMYFLF